jgi:hypothetical protein
VLDFWKTARNREEEEKSYAVRQWVPMKSTATGTSGTESKGVQKEIMEDGFSLLREGYPARESLPPQPKWSSQIHVVLRMPEPVLLNAVMMARGMWISARSGSITGRFTVVIFTRSDVLISTQLNVRWQREREAILATGNRNALLLPMGPPRLRIGHLAHKCAGSRWKLADARWHGGNSRCL